MTKVKVIEVEATKLDPNAVYLIVFNDQLLDGSRMNYIITDLDKKGVKAVYTYAHEPHNALKVYQIPKAKP